MTMQRMFQTSAAVRPPSAVAQALQRKAAPIRRTVRPAIQRFLHDDNVAAKPYPAVLATGGLSDPRVTYWEPEKWTAKLRDHTTSDRPILLKINMDAGHGGASGRFDFLKEIATDYAFAIWAVDGAKT